MSEGVDSARDARVATVLAGGGEMGALIRAFDWAATPLGSLETWPGALKTCVRLMLASRQPMWLGWGEDLIFLYNDPYRAIAGGKHPQALGQPTAVVWHEIWAEIAPRIRAALGGAEGTYDEALLLIMERHGYPEETYYTFSYSPIFEDDGHVAGIFCANTDDTQRVISTRRIALLREMATRTAEARTIADACVLSAESLATNPYAIPFALIYLLDPDQRRATLAGTANIAPGHPAAPAVIPLEDATAWPLAAVVRTRALRLIPDLAASFGILPVGIWDRPPAQAVALPIASSNQTALAGALIVGLNPYRLLDDDYRGFLELAAGQIATALAAARAHEEEHARAEALAALDRAKTTFFSNVSHEFRTPLTLAIGPIEEMLAGDTLPAPDRARLAIAHRNHLRLLRLVNTLLDFARLDAGRIRARYEPTDLAVRTTDLAGMFRSAIERAGLQFRVDCPPLPLPVFVDHEMWEKIVFNLLANALKYTRTGEIAVVLRPAGTTVMLAVQDTGTGIPAAELPHLFDRFHRVQGTWARTHEGTGIGLALVQEMVRLHGGTLAVASTVGVGTTVTVTLPTGTAHLPADQLAPAREEPWRSGAAALYLEETAQWLPEQDGAPPAFPPPAGALAGQPGMVPSARILLAEDNADMCAYIGHLLGARYTVEAVADGVAALAAVRARPPDLLLADVMMPGLDGFEVLRAVRADPQIATLPVILLSARAGEEARVEGLEAGADEYLVKPFSARELVAGVGAHLTLARARALVTHLHRLSVSLAAAVTTTQVAEAILTEGVAALRASGGIVGLLSADGTVFTTLCSTGTPLAVAITWEECRADAPTPLGEAVARREAVIHSVPEGCAASAPAGLALPATGVAIPLLLGERVLGGLDIRFAAPRAVHAADEGLLGALGSLCAQALDRARLYDEAQQARATLAAERDHLQQVLDVLPEGVMIIDRQGQVVLLNQVGRHLVGRDLRQERLAQTGDAAYRAYGLRRADGSPYPAEERPLVRSLRDQVVVQGDRELLRQAGTDRDIPLLVNSAPLRDAAGAVVGAVAVFQDMTVFTHFERAREAFLSAAAHDLKTPLTSIRGLAQLARRRLDRAQGLGIAPVVTQLEHIDAETTRMVGLIDELMDITRLQMGAQLELHRQPTDLVDLVQAVVARHRAATAHPLQVEADVPDLPATVDARRLERVLTNLVSNALKYSQAAGQITVRVAREDRAGSGWAVLTVQDQGLGIPAEDLPCIFERYYRASNVRGQIEGTGIGLASVRQIVEQHGGDVRIESGLGVGTTVTVRLPLDVPVSTDPGT